MKTVNFKFLAMLATTLMAAFVFAACDKDDNKKDEKKPDQQENTNGNGTQGEDNKGDKNDDNKEDNKDDSKIDIPETDGEVKEIDDEYFMKYVWDYTASPDKISYKGDKPVIVDFNAVWCGPCKMLKPVLSRIAKKHAGKSYVYSIDIDKAGPYNRSKAFLACAKKFGNTDGSIPFIILISPKGEKVKAIIGYGKNTEFIIDNFITNNSK